MSQKTWQQHPTHGPGSPFQHILADLLTGQRRPSGGSRKWGPDGHRSLATTEGPVRSQDASSQRHETERETMSTFSDLGGRGSPLQR